MNKEIQKRREALGWARKDLARLARVSDRTVRNVELGRHVPREAIFAAIERALAEGEGKRDGRSGDGTKSMDR
jgi:predicted transcriptional regulator